MLTITHHGRTYHATTLAELEQIAAEAALLDLQARLVPPLAA